MAGIGAFPTCLDISIFLLRKGAHGKVTVLAPKDGPSYAFTFLNDGSKKWTNDLVWEALKEQTHAQIHSWIGPNDGELLETQWSEGDVRLRWWRSAKRFKLIVILKPPLLWQYP